MRSITTSKKNAAIPAVYHLNRMEARVKKLALSTFRSLGQVMLQRNAATGALFALGIAVNSVAMAAAAVMGSLAGTLLARGWRYPESEIEDGLHGFNGALVAIAAVAFYSFPRPGLAIAGIGIVAAALLMRAMQRLGLRPLTFPFVAAVWAAFLCVPRLASTAGPVVIAKWGWMDGVFQAFGQVMFQANAWTGLIFLAAILIHSRRSAAFALMGAALAIGVGVVLHWPADQVAGGIYGYNAVLAAIALSLEPRRTVLPILGTLLSIAITKAMLVAGIPALTFPFIAATWIANAMGSLKAGS